jgi:large subunit ribosomal protein L5
MYFFENYSYNIVKYDLINKFHYKELSKIPKLQAIILQFNLKKYDLKLLIVSLAALELITAQKGFLTKSKTASVSLKIRKGQPVGCKITLRKTKMFEFFFKLLNRIKIERKITNVKVSTLNTFSFKIPSILIFNELEKNYQFFKNLKNLNITIIMSTKNKEDFFFFLQTFKIKT